MFTWPNGKKYEAKWVDGKLHGEGKIIFPNGEYERSRWNNGRKVEFTRIQ